GVSCLWPALKLYTKHRRTDRMYRRYFKRLFDLAVTIVGGLVALPIIAVLCVLVRIKLGSPIFFRQTRPGLNGKPFDLVKFRTMTNATDKDGNPLPDADRLTSFGK